MDPHFDVMTRINPNFVMMLNGHFRQNPAHDNSFSESDKTLLPPLIPFEGNDRGPLGRILLEPPRGVSIDHTDLNLTEPASREAIVWKTSPCKHYIRTQGWCPVGVRCQFIHDLTLQTSEYVNTSSSRHQPNNVGGKLGDTALLGRPCGINTKVPRPHCWSHVQSHCNVSICPYFHPNDIRPYVKYTPCPLWLDCTMMVCPFKHPTKPSDTMALKSSLHPESAQAVLYPPIEINGTTYFDLMGQTTSYDYELASKLTALPQDNHSYRNQNNIIFSIPPPPPPSSPFFGQEPSNYDKDSTSMSNLEHSIPDYQRSLLSQSTRTNSFTQRFSVRRKDSAIPAQVTTSSIGRSISRNYRR